MKKYKPLFWWAEKGHISKSIGPFLRKRMLETNTFVAVDEITPIGDKQTRAQGIHARMAMSRVKFPSFAPWWSKAQDQLLKFPLGAHDDFVDALAYIGLALDKQFMPKRKRQELKAPEVGSVAWLKGETKAQNKARKRAVTVEGW
jgi:predicted phage terminase large subunit-like protein